MFDINYLLQAFGYHNLRDFTATVFKIFHGPKLKILVPTIITAGTASELTEKFIGINLICVTAFVLLCCAEFQTGLKASIKIKGEKVRSRKMGRMIFKIGVYIYILFILNSFATGIKGEVLGFEINPFGWLYYIVLSWIIIQMLISYLENLSTLGYNEARGIKGVILRKFNKWFEFDGSKDADNFPGNQI